MCEYSGEPNDPQRYTEDNFTAEEIFQTIRTLLGESQENCNKVGLPPFYKQNLAPPVSVLPLLGSIQVNSALCLVFIFCVLIQANSTFWARKPQAAAPVEKPKAKIHAPGRRKKQTGEDFLKMDE